jgi:hypothetical protein
VVKQIGSISIRNLGVFNTVDEYFPDVSNFTGPKDKEIQSVGNYFINEPVIVLNKSTYTAFSTYCIAYINYSQRSNYYDD